MGMEKNGNIEYIKRPTVPKMPLSFTFSRPLPTELQVITAALDMPSICRDST